MSPESNVVLIGMPGVGKSTVGVLLAKWHNKSFIDTDVYIQSREGRRLQDILDDVGLDAFRGLEERRVLELQCANHVIATGGSVVYSDAAMRHLKRGGIVVYLWLPLDVIERRVTDLGTRGVVMERGQTMGDLYTKRSPLYEKYSDIRIDCTGLTHEQTIQRIQESLSTAHSS